MATGRGGPRHRKTKFTSRAFVGRSGARMHERPRGAGVRVVHAAGDYLAVSVPCIIAACPGKLQKNE